jgi:hypothetical protein
MDAGSGNAKTNGATAAKPRCRLIGTDGNVFAVYAERSVMQS